MFGEHISHKFKTLNYNVSISHEAMRRTSSGGLQVFLSSIRLFFSFKVVGDDRQTTTEQKAFLL